MFTFSDPTNQYKILSILILASDFFEERVYSRAKGVCNEPKHPLETKIS